MSKPLSISELKDVTIERRIKAAKEAKDWPLMFELQGEQAKRYRARMAHQAEVDLAAKSLDRVLRLATRWHASRVTMGSREIRA